MKKAEGKVKVGPIEVFTYTNEEGIQVVKMYFDGYPVDTFSEHMLRLMLLALED